MKVLDFAAYVPYALLPSISIPFFLLRSSFLFLSVIIKYKLLVRNRKLVADRMVWIQGREELSMRHLGFCAGLG